MSDNVKPGGNVRQLWALPNPFQEFIRFRNRFGPTFDEPQRQPPPFHLWYQAPPQTQLPAIQGSPKTEQCEHWRARKMCRLGEQCLFAHGAEELRPVMNFRIGSCDWFAQGFCTYGERCHFRH